MLSPIAEVEMGKIEHCEAAAHWSVSPAVYILLCILSEDRSFTSKKEKKVYFQIKKITRGTAYQNLNYIALFSTVQ